jgi:ferredoxin
MFKFALKDSPPRPAVGELCLHRHFCRSECRACVEACPTAAIILTEKGPRLDDQQCLHCGDCLFVCPASALENIAAPIRFYRQQKLVAPLSLHPASLNELLLWHAEFHIRGVEVDMDDFPLWGVAIAALNLQLRKLQEPTWQIFPPQEEDVHRARRRLFTAAGEGVTSASVSITADAMHRAYPLYSLFSPRLKPEKCLLCGACSRACAPQAIRMTKDCFHIDSARCSGCGVCSAICPVAAITVVADIRPAETEALPIHQNQCGQCSRPFVAWEAEEKRCPICRQHDHGMR